MPTTYLGTIDGVGDGKTLLLRQLNKVIREQENPNHVDYTFDDFDFSDPERVTIPNPQKNTKIYFGPKLDSGHAGVRKVFYNRIHTSEFKDIRVDYDGESTLVQLLPKINEQLGLLIVPEEILDKPITPPSGDQQVLVQLEFKPESIMYYGGKEIKIGSNDPTGNSAINEFNGYMTLVFNQMVQRDNNRQQLKPLALTFDQSNIKRKTHDLVPIMHGNHAGAAARSMVPNTTAAQLGKAYPFVGFWTHPENDLIRSMDVLGNIYELQDQAEEWQYKSNVFNIDRGNYPQNLLSNPNNLRVKFAVQSVDGQVYFLGKEASSAPAVYRINHAGTVTKLSFPAARMKTLAAQEWDHLQISDVLINNNRIWVALQKAKTQYDLHGSKGRDLPSIEMFNIGSLSTGYYPLGKTSTQFGNIELTNISKLKLITPMENTTHCDAVALVENISNSVSTHFIAHFKFNPTGEYQTSVIPIDPIVSHKDMVLGMHGFELSAGQVVAKQASITQDNPILDVIQVAMPVKSEHPNQFFYDKQLKSSESYYEWGIVTYTRVGNRQAYTPWKITETKLGKEARIQPIALFEKGKKSHVFFQNGQGVIRPMFIQHASRAYFEPKFDLSATVGQNNSFVDVCPMGHGKYITPIVQSKNTPDFVLRQPSDAETAKPEVNFSFVGKDPQGKLQWFTSESDQNPLVLRRPSEVYGFMSEAPVATFSVNNELYYLNQDDLNVFKSVNKARAWYANQRIEGLLNKDLNDPGLFGKVKIKIQPQDIQEAVVLPNGVVMHLSLNRTVSVFDTQTSNPNQTKTIQESVLVKMGSVQTPSNANTITSLTFNISHEEPHPRKVIAWNTDTTQVTDVVGSYTQSGQTQVIGLENYMYNVQGTLLDYSKDIKYLGMRHWILVQDGDVTKLHFTDAVVPKKSFELHGGQGSYSSFEPEVNFGLWKYINEDANYMPYVFYGHNKVLVIEPLKNQELSLNLQTLEIPNDNGQPLKPVVMYTANRRDYWLHQKGNALFELHYNYNPVNESSEITLRKVFDTNLGALATAEIVNGCIVGVEPKLAPQSEPGADHLPSGTLIGHHCQGTTKVTRKADGQGGYTEEREDNAIDCGGTPASNVVGPDAAVGGG